MSKTYSVEVSEQVKVVEQLSAIKRWFNGAKHFFTVKILPPRQ